jgi:hypothetical protein
MVGLDALVEFYDMRAAKLLCQAAGDCATPWTPHAQQLDFNMPALPSIPTAASWPLPLIPPVAVEGATQAEEEESAGKVAQAQSKGEKTAGPTRTKIKNKEFLKYDIDPEKILKGEDDRTTVMVRNLVVPQARKNFLAYLEKCGLKDKQTFFYIPCKEHSNVPMGFAFVNFTSPDDVHRLYKMMKSDLWKDLIRDPQQKRSPALSYARFQGHDQLMKHFSSSAVLSRRDPERRPNFRPNVSTSASEDVAQKHGKDSTGGSSDSPQETRPYAKVTNSQYGVLQAALEKGVQQITELLNHEKSDGDADVAGESTAPAYVYSSITLDGAMDSVLGALPAHGKVGNAHAEMGNSEALGA